jgi:hypothetical protein
MGAMREKFSRLSLLEHWLKDQPTAPGGRPGAFFNRVFACLTEFFRSRPRFEPERDGNGKNENRKAEG